MKQKGGQTNRSDLDVADPTPKLCLLKSETFLGGDCGYEGREKMIGLQSMTGIQRKGVFTAQKNIAWGKGERAALCVDHKAGGRGS